jgi:hypothetical protein
MDTSSRVKVGRRGASSNSSVSDSREEDEVAGVLSSDVSTTEKELVLLPAVLLGAVLFLLLLIQLLLEAVALSTTALLSVVLIELMHSRTSEVSISEVIWEVARKRAPAAKRRAS